MTLAAFDVLEARGRGLMSETWMARRQVLEALDLPQAVQRVEVGPVGSMWAATEELGLEGVVAKHVASSYEPGARSRLWIRRKHWVVSEVLVVGYGLDGERVVRLFTAVDGAGGGVGVVELAISREVADAMAAQSGERRRDAVWFQEPAIAVRVRHHGEAARPRDAQCLGLT